MAHLVLGMHGGWNDESRKHLMLLAKSQGASPAELIRTMQSFTRQNAPVQRTGVAPGAIGVDAERIGVEPGRLRTRASMPTDSQTVSRSIFAREAPVSSLLSQAQENVRSRVVQGSGGQKVSDNVGQSVGVVGGGSVIVEHMPNGVPTVSVRRKPMLTEAEAIARVRAMTVPERDPTKRLLVVSAGVVGVGLLLLVVLLVGVVALSPKKGGFGAGGGAGGGAGAAASGQAGLGDLAGVTGMNDAPLSSTRDPNQRVPGVGTPQPKPLFEQRQRSLKPEATGANGFGQAAGMRRWDDMMRDLRSLPQGIETDRAAALARFDVVFTEMAIAWIETTPDGHAAAADGVIELIFRLSGDRESIQRVLATVSRATELASIPTNKQAQSRVFAGGVLARLDRERDVPAGVRSTIDGLVPAILGMNWSSSNSTFRMGALAAAGEMTGAMMPPVPDPEASFRATLIEAWRGWTRAIDASEQGRSAEGTRRILQAIEDVSLRGPDPIANRAAYEVIGTLTTLVTWRESDASRARLVRWFDAPGVTSSDLHAITVALANSTGASGVDLSMVLSPTADSGQRSMMRDRYSAVWNLSASGERSAQVQTWLDAARIAVALPQEGTPVERLSRGAYLAHLNAMAAHAWAGDSFPVALATGPTQVTVNATGSPVPLGVAPGSVLYLNTPGRGGAAGAGGWGLQYISVGVNIPARRELLQRVGQQLTRMDAGILVSEAVRGSPQQVRQDAQQIVRRLSSDIAIVGAMLDLAPNIPVTIDNSELVEVVASARLPSVRDASWRLEVRRVLVARMLELLAGREFIDVEALSREFDVAYDLLVRASDPSRVVIGTRRDEPPTAVASIMLVRSEWQRRADASLPTGREPMSLAQIAAARSPRLRLAKTSIQRLAVEEANIAELMAFVIVAERPDDADKAKGIIDDLSRERAAAEHIFVQVHAGERAIMRLWMVRLGEESQ